ncbi:hypothetical protein KJ786_03635 [Patescibacteria group bacterium]|nr:hypothetical protein [Patescibacteria group bacterium]
MKIITILRGISRFLIVAVLACFVFYLGGEAGYQVKYRLEIWKINKAMEKFNQSIIEMFEKDTYGGATPEETYNMFVDALKNEDVDLAVKYFVLDPDRQARYQKQFDDLKEQGKLKEYGEEWPKWEEFKQIKDEENDWENRATIEHTYYRSQEQTVDLPNGAGGYLKTVLPAGEYVDYAPVFVKNSNNVWKIENL